MDKPKKISPDQLEQLFAFIEKHYVEYYDLQNELADHLANAIEERWMAQPDLSFNDALHAEFKKFGIFGFTGVVEQRQLALTKKYNKLIWSYFKEFFRLPKILLSLLIGLLIFRLVQYSSLAYVVLLCGVTVFTFSRFIVLNYNYREKVKRTGKQWLFENILKKGGGMIGFGYFFYPIIWNGYIETYSLPGMIYMAVTLTAFSLYQYVVLIVIPNRAEEHLLKTYPEYNL